MTISVGFILLCFFVVLCVGGIFWLINNKLPVEWRGWANVIVAIICILILIIIIINLTGGSVSTGTQIRLR